VVGDLPVTKKYTPSKGCTFPIGMEVPDKVIPLRDEAELELAIGAMEL
jgi:hypothetical protein